jgi:carbon storage regulator
VLVLSRKVGERVLIGENIAVTVVKLTHGGVRIGIDAPPEMAIVREELAARMDAGGRPRTSQTERTADEQTEISQAVPTQ